MDKATDNLTDREQQEELEELASIIAQLRLYMKLMSRRYKDWLGTVTKAAVAKAEGRIAPSASALTHNLGQFTVTLFSMGDIYVYDPVAGTAQILWATTQGSVSYSDITIVMEIIKPLLNQALVLDTLSRINS